MDTYDGKSVFDGIAIGKISVRKKAGQHVKREKIEDINAEIARYKRAKRRAIEQISSLYEKTFRELGEANAAIFKAHQMVLEDNGYNDSVEDLICAQEINAEYAVASTADNFSRMFAAMDDDYIRERAADIRDVSERVLKILRGVAGEGAAAGEPSVIVADDLAPSEIMQFDKDMVLSFVTVRGSLSSHAAILAGTRGIPALVGTPLPLDDTVDGKLGIVDGTEGKIYVDPDKETLARMQKRQREKMERKELLQTLKGRESVTADGKKVMLYANIANIKDLAAVLQNGADGIGLFRSEFIYLEKEDYPTEEEQFQVYKKVAEAMAGRRAVIRTLDIGSDKQCPYFQMEHEENPALGYRAIRICLDRRELFKTQLRAIYRAGIYGAVAVMFPMIISMTEIRQIKAIIAEVKAELEREGIPYGKDIKTGIMIETPAAVLVSDMLAKEVDFFSIGTNDLTQYTLAIDRQNPKLDEFYDAHHPAILRMISMVVENAHKAGIWAGICGELGADETLTREFLAMGVDELSVAPGSILPIRKIVLETNVKEYKSQFMYEEHD